MPAQKLSLNKRPGTIAASITVRTENHGKKEKVPAISVAIKGIPLDATELGVILGDPQAYECLFTTERSKFTEPRFLGIADLVINDEFVGGKVTIKPRTFEDAIVMKPAKVKNITLHLKNDAISFDCMISGIPPEHTDTLAMLNQECTVAILNGAMADRSDNQKDLPLEGGVVGKAAAGEAEDDDDADPVSLADAQREEDEATEQVTGERAARKPKAGKKKTAKKR